MGETAMMEQPYTAQASLLALLETPATLPPDQRKVLSTLLEARLREIAASLATREADDDQDHH
jgi:hypothetical protein